MRTPIFIRWYTRLAFALQVCWLILLVSDVFKIEPIASVASATMLALSLLIIPLFPVAVVYLVLDSRSRK